MSSEKRKYRWIWLLTALVLLIVGLVVAKNFPAEPETQLMPLPEWETRSLSFTVVGIAPAKDTELLLRLSNSIEGVLSSQFDAETRVLKIEVQPEVFRKRDLVQALDHSGLGWHVEGDQTSASYRRVRKALLEDIERRRLKAPPRDEIVFQKPTSPAKSTGVKKGFSGDERETSRPSPAD